MIDLATAVTFGSAPDNDFVINAPMVSGYHARITYDGQNLILEDLQSTNGTFVSGKQIQREVVFPGTSIGLGSYTFTLDPSHLHKLEPVRTHYQQQAAQSSPPTSPPPQQQTAQPAAIEPQPPPSVPQGGPQPSPGAQSVSIGYDPDNVIVIPMPQVSGHHCRLWQDGDTYIIEDLGSSNGTYVNGERVHRSKVKLGDQIGLGSYRFTLEPPMLSHFQKAREEQRTQIGELPPGLVKPIKIGRDDVPGVNDIVLNAPQVSNEHCELQFVGAGWKLRDLGSTNGTYVNSRQNRIREVMVGPKDVLFFGSYRFPMSRLLEFLGKGTGGSNDDLQIPTGIDGDVAVVITADHHHLFAGG
ncbi:MAG: FHA domain-containing protein, partial [Myxococcota bacterium]